MVGAMRASPTLVWRPWLSRGGTDRSGAPPYMAPEQLKGESAALRSDVFALGLGLREMLTGERRA